MQPPFDFRTMSADQLREVFNRDDNKELMTQNNPGQVPVPEYLPLFVYGTLMPGFGNFDRLLKGNFTTTASATVTGFQMLDLGAFPMVVLARSTNTIRGVMIYVKRTEFEKVLKSLDQLEGYPTFYDRVIVRARAMVKDPQKEGAYLYQDTDCYMYAAPLGTEEEYKKLYPVVAGGSWMGRISNKGAQQVINE